MRFNHTLSAVLRGHWLINQEWASSHLPLVVSMLKGNKVDFIERSGSESYEQPFCVDPATMQRYEAYRWDDQQGKYIPNPNVPPNSVAIIPITGPITKYNGDCGEPGTIQKNSWLLDMDRRANIGSVILLIDTPGGEAQAAPTIVSTLVSYSKPVLSFIDGWCASLGMWLCSATKEVYLSSKMDKMGSIGSYCMLLDFTGYLEKEGIKMHEIYAPQSVDKNKDYRDALKGDYTLISKDLEIHVNDFISFVKSSRGGKAAASEKEWSTGKMFYGEDAVNLGLADGIRSFNQVVSKAAWLARRNKV